MATAAGISGTHPNSKIPARWAGHYRRLCAERDRLMARDCCSLQTSRVKLYDFADAGSNVSQASLLLVEVGATQNMIFEVLAAIRRIERGTYGMCELTGCPIEADRLLIIPWTRYSFRGQ